MENEDLIEEYIMGALFALMKEKPFASITVTDIAKKAGVSRITYYRRFKSKEEVIIRYFARQTSNYQQETGFRPRNKEDYYEAIFTAFSQFKKQKEFMKLLLDANVQYIYLDVLNRGMSGDYSIRQYGQSKYDSAYFAGALYNMSFEWLKNDCQDSVKSITDAFFNLAFSNNNI